MPQTSRLDASRPSATESIYRWAEGLLEVPAIFNLSQLLISGGQRATKRWAAAWLDLQPGERLLDVCCGTGDFAPLFTRSGDQHGDYLGIDLNDKYIRYARRRYGHGGTLRFEVGDATRLSLPAASFDKVLFANSMHHLPDDLTDQVLRQIARTVRPGGRLVVIDLVGDHPGAVQQFFLHRDRGARTRPMAAQRALLDEHFLVQREATFNAGFTPQTIFAATPRPAGRHAGVGPS